jgi:hypothetical protein
MGESADHTDTVLCAANAMADRQQFSLAQSQMTIRFSLTQIWPLLSQYEELDQKLKCFRNVISRRIHRNHTWFSGYAT